MTSDMVRQLVEQAIAGDWQISNTHGCDLRRCLVPPILADFDDVLQATTSVGGRQLWLVLEELPETRDGYKIVFDEKVGMFGLAVSGQGRDVFIGFYGTFLQTYAAM